MWFVTGRLPKQKSSTVVNILFSGDEAFLEEEAEAIGSYEEAQKKLSNNIAEYNKAVEKQRRLREHLWAKHGQWAKKEFKSWGAFFDNMPESMLDQLEAITDTGFSFGRNDPLPTVKDVDKAHRGWAQVLELITFLSPMSTLVISRSNMVVHTILKVYCSNIGLAEG